MTPDRLIERLLAQHGQELARHLRRIVRDDAAAQDLLQDTFFRAHRALGREHPANLRAWLYRIATNVALNHVRGRVRERRALDAHAREVAGPAAARDHDDVAAERRRLLWTRVAELPQRQRLAITLRLADELEYPDIARRMGCSVEAARANVHQATKKLRLEVRS